jgi:hypothetical protein
MTAAKARRLGAHHTDAEDHSNGLEEKIKKHEAKQRNGTIH